MAIVQKNGRRVKPPNSQKTELGHVPILEIPVKQIQPSPENDRLYRPVDLRDPTIKGLAKSIHENGLLEPIVITADFWIVSGHRRYAAAKLAGLKAVPCRILPNHRIDDIDAFVRLLREHNRQRDKTRSEKLREEIVSINPQDAHEALVEYRRAEAAVDVEPMEISAQRTRAKISPAKIPFLKAVQAVLKARRKFWPLSDRQIHYGLLNDTPLRHASKPDSRYDNTPQSYKSLVDLLTRARLDGSIPMEAISDETRPVATWGVHQDPRSFMQSELANLFKDYWRDLQQSQPNHIELVGEKNTVGSILRPVASDYCIPMTTGRGFCSMPPRYAMAKRFKASGKSKLVLLIVSDHDPDGDQIADSFARSMRDDFGITNIHPIRVALTAEQVQKYKLPPLMVAKKSSVNCAKFVERHGSDDVFELEALAPEQLQEILREVIEAVIDRDAHSAEIEEEQSDSAFLEGARRVVMAALEDVDFDNVEGLD